MATDFFIKKDDTAPALVAILKDATGGIVDLTAASVKFIMTHKTTGDVIEGDADVLDDTGGKVSYQWATGDTEVVGGYKAEFEVAWGDGTFETFPNSSYINIKVTADLGGTV